VTLLEAAAALRARRVSAVELATESLARIESLESRLDSFITATGDRALARARQADRELAAGAGAPFGPLHGIPVALKDLFATRGVRTTCGSQIYADFVPDYDAAVVERLEAAGAVSMGKLNMHELAYGITSANPHFGPVRNPWDVERSPGGSSGGAGAAVAAETVFAALGSDTGGSIRIPASFCGTVGLKPTYGRVSRYGALPLGYSLDHMGPLARTVRDAAVVLEVIAGHDWRDDTSSRRPVDSYVPAEGCSIRGLAIGVPENYFFERLDPDVEAAVRAAIQLAARLGAVVKPVRVPDVAALNAVARVILLAEASAQAEPHLAKRAQFGADVLALFDQGRLLAATDYVNAQRLRRRLRGQFDRIWEGVDCLLTPTTPNLAPRIGETTVNLGGVEEDVRLASTRLVRGINALGYPALSIPCGAPPGVPSGPGRSGLPVGLQLIGAAFQEALILRVGAALEDAGLTIPRCPLA
jgi:aspartyl-tRNA(Asn)/glutamyl-tRNA(Gln) amidotransferase subunit A